MSEQAAAPSAPTSAPSTTSAPASSSAPSKPASTSPVASTPAAPSSPARLTSAQMRAKLDGGTFESAISAPDAEPESDPAMPDLADLGIESEPEETPEVQAEPSDDPFAAFRDADIHGMKALDILKAISEGKLPDALMDKLVLDLKDGDETWQDTVAAARNGAQMQRKFTQKSQQLAEERRGFEAERQQFAAERDDLVDFLRSWKEDPAKLRAGLMKLGMPFRQAAELEAADYGEEVEMRKLEAENKLPAGTTDKWLKAKQAELELEAARLQQERWQRQQQAQQQQAQQQDSETKIQATAKSIANEAVKIFDQLGVKRGTGEWNYFRTALGSIWTPGQAQPSRAELEAAVRATKQWADEQRAALTASKPAAAPKLGKAPLDGGAPTKPTPGAKPTRLTAAQAKAKYLK